MCAVSDVFVYKLQMPPSYGVQVDNQWMLDSDNDSECSFYEEDDQQIFFIPESIKQDNPKSIHAQDQTLQWNLAITNEDDGWDSDGSHGNGVEPQQGSYGN